LDISELALSENNPLIAPKLQINSIKIPGNLDSVFIPFKLVNMDFISQLAQVEPSCAGVLARIVSVA
jgi:hypothetical protein